MSALLPVALDLERLSVVLVGNGARAERRLGLLDEAGATRVRVFADAPETALSARAGDRLRRRLPAAEDFRGADLAFVADPAPGAAKAVAETARQAGALVNVEDATASCDFHSAAVIRRGDLALGITTGGRCPMLVRVLKEWLDRLLPRDLARTVEALADRRRRLKARRAPLAPLEIRASRAVAQLEIPHAWRPADARTQAPSDQEA